MLGAKESRRFRQAEAAGLGLFCWSAYTFLRTVRDVDGATAPALILAISSLLAVLGLTLGVGMVRRRRWVAHPATWTAVLVLGVAWSGLVAWRMLSEFSWLTGFGLVMGTRNLVIWLTNMRAIRSEGADGPAWTPPLEWKPLLARRFPRKGLLFIATTAAFVALAPMPPEWMIQTLSPYVVAPAMFAVAAIPTGMIYLGVALYLHDFDLAALDLDIETDIKKEIATQELKALQRAETSQAETPQSPQPRGITRS